MRLTMAYNMLKWWKGTGSFKILWSNSLISIANSPASFQVGSVVKDLIEEVDELFSEKDKDRDEVTFDKLLEEPRI